METTTDQPSSALDLSFFLEAPELTTHAELVITPLAPLSMVSSQPGTYFRSEMAPTPHMIYGLLENALGWHFHKDLRNELRKALAKLAKKDRAVAKTYKDSDWLAGKLDASGSGYESLLIHHVRLSPKQEPDPAISYDDLWSMQLHDKGGNFLGGSRNYDTALEALMTAAKSKEEGIRVEFGDRLGFERVSLEEAIESRGAKVHVSAIREAFPQYYVSPKKRGYVELGDDDEGIAQNYVYEIITTPALSHALSEAVHDPAGPLYLGSNDGWVDVKWNQL